MKSHILGLLAFALIGVRRRKILISALLMSLFALPAAGDELQLTFTGAVEIPASDMPDVVPGTPYVVSFDLNTLSGDTQLLLGLPPLSKVVQIETSNLVVTNFSATLGGSPFSSLPAASGHLIAQDIVSNNVPNQFFEPLLSVNNVFSWDFLVPNATITQETSDPVAALILGHEGPGLSGGLGGNEISFKTANIVDISLSSVPEPATLSLLGLGLAGVGLMRRRKKH